MRVLLLFLFLAGCAIKPDTDRFLQYASVPRTTMGITTEKVEISGMAITTFYRADATSATAKQRLDVELNKAALTRVLVLRICTNPEFKNLSSNGYRFFVDWTTIKEDGGIFHGLAELTPRECAAL